MISLRNKIINPFKHGYFSKSFNLPLISKNFSTKPKSSPEVKAVSPMKLVFTEDNKATIYKYSGGESDLNWLVRGNFAFLILNGFLFISETVQPIFGGWNYFSFGLGFFIALANTLFLHVVSRRTIKEIKLFRTGDYVEIHYFNAYWIPKSKVYHITEFANMTPTYFGYMRSEITSLEKNSFAGFPMYDEMTREVLNGKIIKLSRIDNLVNKFQKSK